MPGDHARHEERAQVDHRLDVGADHGELGVAVGPVHRSHGGEAGVVDQDVGRQAALGQRGRELGARVGVGQVGGDHLGPDRVRPRQLVGQRLQPVLAPGHEGHSVAAPRQLACDLRADARRGTGDDGGRVLLGGRECHAPERRGATATRRSAVAPRLASQGDEVRVTPSVPTRAFANALFAWGSHAGGRGRYWTGTSGNRSTRRCPEWKGAADAIDTLDRGGRSAGLRLRHRCRFR